MQTKREQLLNLCRQEAPCPKTIERVRAAIGMPPNAVTWNHLTNQLSDIDEDLLERILDVLHVRDEISITNGWIHGIKKVDTSSWTKDDWDWYCGTGRFAQ